MLEEQALGYHRLPVAACLGHSGADCQIFNRNFENVFLCVLTLFLFGVPNMVEHRLDIELPNTLEIIILLFIYAAEILGEINAYYVTFPYWIPCCTP